MENPEQTDQTRANTDLRAFGDSREHVGWFLYPRIRTSRRRVFKGTRSLRRLVAAATAEESILPTADEAQVTTAEPKTDAETGE